MRVLSNPRIKLVLGVLGGLLWLGWCLAALKVAPVRDVRVASMVGVSPWGAPHLFDSFPALRLVPMFIVQLLATWCLGFLGFRALFGPFAARDELPTPIRALVYGALFLPGYLGWIAIHRSISLVLVNGFAMPMCWLVQLGVIGWTLRSLKWKLKHLPSLGLMLSGLAFWLLFQIQYSFVHVTGDAFLFILQILGAPLENGPLDPWSRFPRLRLHYDEIMYWYPSLSWYQGAASQKAFGLWWLAGAAGKLSAFSLTVLACARLLRDEKRALIWAFFLTVFLFFGTHFIDPRASFILFDSSNPGANLLHSGRLVHAFLAIWCLAWIDLDADRFANQLSSRVSKIAMVILTLGLSATTLPHLLTVACVPLFILSRKANKMASNIYWKLPLVMIPLTLWFMYPESSGAPQMSGSLLWVPLALGFGLWFSTTLRSAAAQSFSIAGFFRSDWFRFGWAPLALGHLIFGNLLAVGLPGLPLLLDRSLGEPISGAWGLMRSNLCGQWPTWHCMTRYHLVGHFGFPIALAAATVFSFPSVGTPRAEWFKRSVTWTLLAFTATLFAYDWINTVDSPPASFWVKSRLTESFFYSLIATSFLVLIQAGRVGKWTAGLLILAYSLGPLALEWEHSVLKQLWLNLNAIVSL